VHVLPAPSLVPYCSRDQCLPKRRWPAAGEGLVLCCVQNLNISVHVSEVRTSMSTSADIESVQNGDWLVSNFQARTGCGCASAEQALGCGCSNGMQICYQLD
jgi:hypothetical protein